MPREARRDRHWSVRYAYGRTRGRATNTQQPEVIVRAVSRCRILRATDIQAGQRGYNKYNKRTDCNCCNEVG